MARKISVEIVGDSRSLERAFSRSERSARRFNVGVGTLVKSAVVFRLANEAMTGLASAVGGSIREFSEQQKVAAQTNAVLKSTGSIAGVTGKRVDKLASSIQSYSGIDDEAVKAGENLILTFKNVRNEIGKGNAIFDRATKAAVDLSVAGFGSLHSTSIQLGKALNDPVKGMTALGRAGVTFTAGQKKTIKSLVASNRLLDAQKLILREVESQVGGSAKAFGKTIPGALARTSEAFKNMGGAIVGALAPAFTRVANIVAAGLPKIQRQVENFVSRLQAARTVNAKIDVVLTTVGDLGARALEVANQIRERVGAALAEVDWRQVGQRVSAGLASALSGIAVAVRSVDWGRVGQEVVHGVADFLKGVDWVAVFKGIVRLWVAALKGLGALLFGAGKEMAKQLVQGIGDGIVTLGNALKKKVLQLALAIIEPLDFTVLGRHLVPGLHGLVKQLEAELDDLAAHSEKTARRVQSAMRSLEGATPRGQVGRGQGAKVVAAIAEKAAAAEKTGADAPAKARKAGAAAAKRAAAQAVKAAEIAKTAFEALLDSLNLNLERAQATARLGDDLKALRKIETALKARIKAEGRTTDLARQLFQNRQAQADLARQQRQGSQFEALGLTAGGEKKIPNAKALHRHLGRISEAIKGTFLDTGKTQSQLARIAKVLSGQFGKVGSDVRAAILQMFSDISGALKGGSGTGPLTKAKKLNINALLANAGLSPDQIRELRSRLSQVTSGAPRSRGGSGSLAFATAGQARAQASPPGGFVVHTHIHLDGKEIATSTTRHQQKTNRRRAGSRGGVRPGGGV